MKKSPPTPLLTRLTHLFRKSGAEAPDSEQSVPAPAAETDALKLRLKQKRRDDAIRGREFNQLRNVIRNEQGIRMPQTTGVFVAAPAARNSGMGALGRDSILDKIDGAQAHLEHWWGSESGHATLTRMPEGTQTAAAPIAADDDDLDLDFTGMQGLSADAPLAADPPEHASAAELSPFDSGLRDAALLFAEGEFDAAQTVLTTLLNSPDLDSDATELLTFALFDVYRCAGQQERFDALAMDYAHRFGRSPAEWFVLPQASPPLPDLGQATPDADTEPAQQTFWECPAILDTQAFSDGISRQTASEPVCAINWASLQHIDAATEKPFSRQIAAWCENPVELQWLGVDALLAALQMCRLSGDASANQPWWLIQLDILCILQRAAEFDELALEYCITFEVSPPSWKNVACILAKSHDTLPVLEFMATVPNSTYETVPINPSTFGVYELRGNITGDMPKALRELRKASNAVAQISVTCSYLGRIDFRAAAALMGWAEDCRARGCQVQFNLLPRLVLVYFHMLGMEKIASVCAGPH